MTLVARVTIMLAALAVATGVARTQNPETAPTTRGSFEKLIGKGDIVYVIGVHALRVGDMELRCEVAVVWLDKEGSASDSKPIGAETRRNDINIPVGGRRVKEIYAEGEVRLRQREEVHQCHSVFLDLVHERGIVVDPRSRFPVPTPTGQPAKLHVKAAELRILSETNMQMIGARVSTCPFGNPHYHLDSETVDLFRARASGNRPPDQEQSQEQVPNFYYTASGNTLYVDSAYPVLWLPDFSGSSAEPLGKTYRHIKDVRIGKSGEFGTQVGLSVGSELKTKEGRKWGEWVVDLDYLGKRGPGVGVDFTYEQPCFVKGELKTSYQRDVGEDKLYGEPPTNDRYRVSWQQRAWLVKEFQLDLEANLFSDRGYYPTYFESEFKTEKPPETYAYLKKAFESSAVTGLFSIRGNDFETTTEYRPKLDYVLVTDPIADVFKNPLYLTAHAQIAQPRQIFDEDLHLSSVDTLRADVDTLLEYPFLAGPVKVTPFGGIRTTYYEYDLARNLHNERTGFTWGAEASMQFSRNYNCRGGLFDLDGLRHVVTPSVEYRNISGVKLHPEELFQYDPVDAFDDEEIVTFELRNLFQTVRHRKNKPAMVDEVLDLDLEMAWFPRADRDNDGDSFSNLFGDVVVHFSDELNWLAEFEWNPNDGDLEAFDTAVGWTPSEKLQIYAGLNHFDRSYDLVYGQASWRASEKWMLRGLVSYDFQRGRFSDNDLVISRIGHDWVFSVILSADFNRDDFSFSIGLEPRFLFDPLLRPRGLRRQPEFQWLGSQIYK